MIDKKDLKVGDIIKTDKGKELEVKSITPEVYHSETFEPVSLIVVYDKEMKDSYKLGDNTNVTEVIEHRDVKVVKVNDMFGIEYMTKEEAEKLYPNGKKVIEDIATGEKTFYDIKIEDVVYDDNGEYDLTGLNEQELTDFIQNIDPKTSVFKIKDTDA